MRIVRQGTAVAGLTAALTVGPLGAVAFAQTTDATATNPSASGTTSAVAGSRATNVGGTAGTGNNATSTATGGTGGRGGNATLIINAPVRFATVTGGSGGNGGAATSSATNGSTTPAGGTSGARTADPVARTLGDSDRPADDLDHSARHEHSEDD